MFAQSSNRLSIFYIAEEGRNSKEKTAKFAPAMFEEDALDVSLSGSGMHCYRTPISRVADVTINSLVLEFGNLRN
ncbi:hypothetical protein VNO77_34460 [Canavalia gladiata]|uniref:Uncharacterized protein n=1 Tax=Canavalia gladiata TaxID=3824 RepID=A0AAN9KGG4_CANGL